MNHNYIFSWMKQADLTKKTKLDIRGLKRFKHLSVLHHMEFNTVFCAPPGRHILPDIYACAIKAEHRYFAYTLQDCTSLRLKKPQIKKPTSWLVSIVRTSLTDTLNLLKPAVLPMRL